MTAGIDRPTKRPGMLFFRKKKKFERRDERYPAFVYVEISALNGAPLAAATVHEISKSGAQIKLQSDQTLPERIHLWFPRHSTNVDATIRWSSDRRIGVEFDEPIEIPTSASSRKDRIDVVTAHLERAGIR
jgi:hypothetical protein